MTLLRTSLFREALQVTRERIKQLTEGDLDSLMNDLLHGQAYRCGADPSKVEVNTETKAADEGCDGSSPKPPAPDPWLGDAETCWQFKAGVAGTRSKLKGEVKKPLPRATLKKGGRFVIVASGATSGRKGVEERLKAVRAEAKAAKIPMSRIEVLGSERLTAWCNQHPAVAARFAGRPEGLWRLDDWLNASEHQAPWKSTAELDGKLVDGRRDLDFSGTSTLHLHIQGPPGVGKTRFALELCRHAPWKSAVIYVRQAADLRLVQLIDGATVENDLRLVVVADEIQEEQLRPLRDSLDRGNGRVRLITIGHSASPDPARIPAILVAPLEIKAMAEVITNWHEGMPIEHVQFVTRFADGYVRLARLAADEIMRNPTTDIRGLLDLRHVRDFLDRMLGDGDRRALHVVAVLSRVGWTDDLQAEGEAIARHLGQDWNQVRVTVERFQNRLGIAPRGGRYRYISPTPLAIYLAVEAWTAQTDLLKTLPNVLPSEEAKARYDERLQQIASNPNARKFAREELALFFSVADFTDAWNARRWAALSAADPALAARNILKALTDASLTERLAIDAARREIVHRLVQIAWNRSTFYDATFALALLGEAENEGWANNASNEFIARFEVGLGGTSLPYVDRMALLDEVLATGRPALIRLVIRALSRVYNQSPMRWDSSALSAELREPEWHPRSGQEWVACIEAALGRLTSIARTGVNEVQGDLVKAAQDLSMLLREAAARPLVAGFFEAVRETFPLTREPLRRAIADIAHRERKYWHDLSPEDLSQVDALHARFEDGSLSGRLRQEVGPGMWEKDEAAGDLGGLASQLIGDRGALEREWPWLTSGEAGDVWKFGEALALADGSGLLDDTIASLPGRGRDLRVLCGYVSKRREQNGTEWFDSWMTRTIGATPDDLPLLFEISWRCGVTVATERLLATTVREKDIPSAFMRQLENGNWPESLPLEDLKDLLAALCSRGHRTTAVAVLEHRLRKTPSDLKALEPIALDVVTSGEVIRDGAVMTDYYWKEVALRLGKPHVRAIVAAIFREQADRTQETWFAEYQTAKEVLLKFVELDPAGVWRELAPHLSSMVDGYRFSVGFPAGLLDSLPVEDVGRWVAEKPDERAAIIAQMVNKSLMNDNTLTARILGQFGGDKLVASAFFSSFASGSWTGPSSQHWAGIAAELERVAKSTKLPKLRRWAEESAAKFRRMEEHDRQREEEEDLRGR